VSHTWLRALPPSLSLLLVPILVLTGDRSLIFNHAGSVDPWLYYGLYRNLSAIKTLFPSTYYASRLSLILPGYLANQLFSPLIANYLLHLLIWLGAVTGLFLAVKHIAGRRSALVAATVFGFYPYLWKAVGWDYPDGIGNAYYLLTIAFLTLAARSPAPSRSYLFWAGVTCAGALYCNLTWAFLLPSLGPYWLFLRTARGAPLALGRTLQWSAAGFFLVTVVFAVVNYRLSGSLLFYLPSITYALEGVKTVSPYGANDTRWIFTSPWLYLPMAAVLSGPIALARFRWRHGSFHARMVIAHYVNLLFCAGVLVLWELAGQPLLQIPYYASYLLAPSFLFLGVAVFPVSETLGPSRFFLLLTAVMGACSLVWWDPTGTTWLWLLREMWSPALAMAAVVAAGFLAGRTRPAALAALGVSVLALNSRLPESGIWWRGGSQAEDAFLRIVEGIEIAAEAARPAKMIRFWYDASDENVAEFSSINSSYLFLYTKIPTNYPTLPDSPIEGLTAVLSSLPDRRRQDTLAMAQESLNQIGFAAAAHEDQVIDRGGVRYRLTILDVELDMEAVRAFGYLRNGDFESQLAPWAGGWAKLRVVEGGQSGKCLELDAEQGSSQYAMQWNFAWLEPGRRYRLTAWVRSGSSGDEPFRVGLWDDKALRWVAARDARTTNQWQEHSLEFTNDSPNRLSLELMKDSPSAGTMLFDSITLAAVQ